METDHRKQADRAYKIEYRVRICDHTGIHRGIPEVVKQSEMMNDRDHDQNHSTFAQVVQDIHDTDPPGFPVCADGAYNSCCHAVSQVNTDDYGIDGFKGQQSAGGKRLQDTNCCRRALQHKRHTRAGQIAQERIVSQSGKQLFHHAGFLQCIHGAGHVQQAGKQDAETDRYITDRT